jgi:DNA-binding beta-propeller fold protein YncE
MPLVFGRFQFVESRGVLQCLLTVLITGLAGCGGGSGSSGQPPQDFSLSLSPTSMALQQLGGGAQLDVSIVPVNGFSGSVTITFPNLPAGISVAPVGSSSGPPYFASPGQALSVGISASQDAAVGNGTITIQGTSANLAHSTMLGISVSAEAVFQLTVSPSTVTIGPNGLASALVTLVPGDNFGSNTVFLSASSGNIGNTGVDMNISSEFLTAAQPQSTISFQSGFQVQTGNNIQVPVTGSLGLQVENVPLTLNVSNPAPACTSASRSTTRRTDMDPTGVVYDPANKLVFAAVDQTNSVQVYSAADAHTVGTIPIAAARGLDISPDGSRLLVGSRTLFLSWVDPNSLQVIGQVPVVSSLFNGGNPPTPLRPIILASGKVLVDMDSAPVEWDPATNTWTDPTPPGFAPGDIIFRRSADHTKVVVAPVLQNSLAIFDSATDGYGPVQNITARAATLNSNGSKLAVIVYSPTIPGGNQVTLYDSRFNVLATYQLNADIVPTDLIFSRDDSMIYVLTLGGFAAALHATDLSFAGALPNPGTGGGADYPPDIDETNMIFSPGGGLRSAIFTDASAPCALGVNEPYNMSLTPPQGTVNTPSATVLSAVAGITASSQVYFGASPGSPQATPGTNLVYSPPTSIQVTTPSSTQSDAVDVTVTNPDGSLGIVLDGFSYGSNVLAVTTTSGAASGGTSVKIYGYGLAFDKSEIQVTVGGKSAAVTDAFAGPGISPFPFPMDQVTFTTPAGNPGPADIIVTTPVGSATISSGFHYLQNVQTFPISSTLSEVVYDHSRQRLYTADYNTNKVYVFDLSTQNYLMPITVGNSPTGLAITPDFTTLAVTNAVDSSVSIVDLTGVSATRTVSLSNLSGLPQQCGPAIPFAIATTSNKQAVVGISCTNTTEGEFVVVNLATQAIGCGTSQGCAAMLAAYPQALSYVLAVAASADGNNIFLSNGGLNGLWNVTSDTFTSQPNGGGLAQYPPVVLTAAAGDGNIYAQFYAIDDPDLYQFSFPQDVDYLPTGINDVNWVPGEKLHPSGALLYFPQNNGLDIYDSHHGHIVRRVILPVQLPVTFDAMAIDQAGSQVFLISASGLTIVNIADLPLSVGSLTPAQGSASGGVSVRIRGSGFQSGATVMFGSAGAVVSFVDSNTLQVTTPALPVGAARITVANPDGTEYMLDDAFTAN